MKLQGLANGFPLSAVISRKELTDRLRPGSMVRVIEFLTSIALSLFRVERILGMLWHAQLE